ncbi:MAG: UDP-N-acetylmuramate dehydrogenase [Acidimicrobiia bacterium]|nr:UDP-N-acetylmuramate dehydrogenase [Acidimicrobiia bacterium]MYE67364.1 UDP-N-acetylmuramate dehydrogenase [Acidimicrobiia bacterium]MYJ12844.1 UDP-N-acetylmuramate dehydrogenase [Acidimicrobiia bacterium]
MPEHGRPPAAPDWPRLARSLAARLSDSRVAVEAPLGALSTYRVGGCARLLVEVGTAADLRCLAGFAAVERWNVLVVGNGSNLLVADSGFEGVALRLTSAFAAARIEGSSVTAGAAALLPVLARRCAAAGLGGLGWAVGVPGSVGGAVRMNAGGHGSDMREVLRWADIADFASGGQRRFALEELALGYRTSALQRHHVVVEVECQLRSSQREREEELIRQIVAWRRRHQPGGANTGSVFANPPGDSAGRLAEAAGCKGLRIGSAAVSTVHANFIQADLGGSASDVLALMTEVARRVRSHSGIRLRHETCLVGFDEPSLRDLGFDGPGDVGAGIGERNSGGQNQESMGLEQLRGRQL